MQEVPKTKIEENIQNQNNQEQNPVTPSESEIVNTINEDIGNTEQNIPQNQTPTNTNNSGNNVQENQTQTNEETKSDNGNENVEKPNEDQNGTQEESDTNSTDNSL